MSINDGEIRWVLREGLSTSVTPDSLLKASNVLARVSWRSEEMLDVAEFLVEIATSLRPSPADRMDLINHLRQKIHRDPESYANPAKLRVVAGKIIEAAEELENPNHLPRIGLAERSLKGMTDEGA